MLCVTNIRITKNAYPVLLKHRLDFVPRLPGDVFGLCYVSSFVEPDGTTVAGFKPGYERHSVSPEGRSDMWVHALPAGGPDFLFMPRFKWNGDKDYVVDLVGGAYTLFSIGQAGRARDGS